MFFNVQLWAQNLGNDGLKELYNGAIVPRDRNLGKLYAPSTASNAQKQIVTLLTTFWNYVGEGKLDEDLVSLDGVKQIREQLAPFLLRVPDLYREGLISPAVRAAEPAKSVERGESEGQKPLRSLVISRIRLAMPQVFGEEARIKCRIGLRGKLAFMDASLYFIKEESIWRVDAIDVDWDNVREIANEPPLEVFGRLNEFY